jgi:hypothetical protein
MVIIGHSLGALEEISTGAAPGSQAPPARPSPERSSSPCRSVPSESLLEASSFAASAVHVLDVWQHLPEEVGHLLRERLVLMARRLQEGRRSTPLHNGGSQ